jgi:AbrB family looped-hinge helix DNA binding protein
MARIYEKGQLTLPKAVREAVGLAPGDRVVVEARDGEIVVRRPTGVLEYEPPRRGAGERRWSESRVAAREDRAARLARR